MFKQFKIKQSILKKMIDYAEKNNTKEVCGLALGYVEGKNDNKIGIAKDFYKIDNITTKEEVADFVMEPKQMYQVMMKTKLLNPKSKMDKVVLFHSHPFWKSHPSPIDLDRAEEDVVYLIYSPAYKTAQAWTLEKRGTTKEFHSLNIEVL